MNRFIPSRCSKAVTEHSLRLRHLYAQSQSRNGMHHETDDVCVMTPPQRTRRVHVVLFHSVSRSTEESRSQKLPCLFPLAQTSGHVYSSVRPELFVLHRLCSASQKYVCSVNYLINSTTRTKLGERERERELLKLPLTKVQTEPDSILVRKNQRYVLLSGDSSLSSFRAAVQLLHPQLNIRGSYRHSLRQHVFESKAHQIMFGGGVGGGGRQGW